MLHYVLHDRLYISVRNKLRQLSAPLHGHPTTLTVTDAGDLLLQKIAPPLIVGRYHSWIVDSGLDARRADCKFATMKRDTSCPFITGTCRIHGVQFHPESCISNCGPR